METSANATDCFEQIHKRIMSLQYPPGIRLSVGTISQELGIDPTIVREALARLVETGLIESDDTIGFRVCPFSETDMSDLFYTYGEIESLALKQSIDSGNEEWEEKIRNAVSQLAHVESNSHLSRDNYWLWSQRHWAFHFALVSACKSNHLLRIRNQLFKRFEYYFQLALGDKGQSLAFESETHGALAEAAIRKEKQKAVRILVSHSMDCFDKLFVMIKFG